MKRILGMFSGLISAVAILATISLAAASADSPPELGVPSHLAIAEVKMTGDEFIVLQNNSQKDISDLSQYWLYSFNKTNPRAAGATTDAEQLPVASLGAGQSVLLSSGGATCGAEVTAKLSISLGDSAGALQLMRSNNASGLLDEAPTDAVSWGAGGDIGSVPSSSKDKQAAFYRVISSSDPLTYGWQQADIHIDQATGVPSACQLDVVTASGGGLVSSLGNNNLLPPSMPPATIVSIDSPSGLDSEPRLPAQDFGLQAPQVSELLPNPSGLSNDATDEFIELYNSNATDFDLSGFVLQTGVVAKHKYIFPGGTILPAKTFVAFYAAETRLSLSNSGGQAALLDPFGDAISQSDAYASAKDGMSWALAKGKWYWTSNSTPGAANVIVAGGAKTNAAPKSKGSNAAAVKGASTTNKAANIKSGAITDAAQVTSIHPWTLAVVAVLAVAYGIYEYRLDLQNRLHEFKRHRAAR